MRFSMSCVFCCALFLAACSQPPVDPASVLSDSFITPKDPVTIVDSDGPESDAWLVITTDERIELQASDIYQIFDPQPAYQFFVSEIGADALGALEDYVCLAWRNTENGADQGAYLLFVPGSGRYFFRHWS